MRGDLIHVVIREINIIFKTLMNFIVLIYSVFIVITWNTKLLNFVTVVPVLRYYYRIIWFLQSIAFSDFVFYLQYTNSSQGLSCICILDLFPCIVSYLQYWLRYCHGQAMRTVNYFSGSTWWLWLVVISSDNRGHCGLIGGIGKIAGFRGRGRANN